MALRYKDIGEIISLIDASSCEEFVLETDELKLVLRRRGAGTAGASPTATPEASRSSPAAPSNPGGADRAEAAAAPRRTATFEGPEPGQSGVVSAPMIGTFYRAPAPDAPPLVEVGATVKPGDPLCLIEVMKLFTTIYAEFAGVVREIGADNGQLVEYGQMLFVIEPD